MTPPARKPPRKAGAKAARKPAPARTAGAKRARTQARDWKPAFIAAFEQTGTIVQAAKAAGVDRRTVQRARQADEDFALAFADADDKLTETLESVAFTRAIRGSDRLMEFLLKARRPEKYRETSTVHHQGDITIAKPVTHAPNSDEERARIAGILAAAGALDLPDAPPTTKRSRPR